MHDDGQLMLPGTGNNGYFRANWLMTPLQGFFIKERIFISGAIINSYEKYFDLLHFFKKLKDNS